MTRFAARRLIVNVLPWQRTALEVEAERRGTTVSEVVRGLIEKFADRSEQRSVRKGGA